MKKSIQNRTYSVPFVFAVLTFLVGADPAVSEVLSTSSLGLGVRQMSYSTEKRSETDFATSETRTETFVDPVLCQRLSTASRIGVELGSGGCVHYGGKTAFVHTIKAQGLILWYPLASLGSIDDDGSIKMKRQFFSDFYISGSFGFAKTTHAETDRTVFSLTMDSAELGIGAGWNYRVLKYVALGGEAMFAQGIILSRAATGTTSFLTATINLTVFL